MVLPKKLGWPCPASTGSLESNDRCTFDFFLALGNILGALTRDIGDSPCFLYIKFSWFTEITLNQELCNIFVIPKGGEKRWPKSET